MPIVCGIGVPVNSQPGQLRAAYDAFVAKLVPEDMPCIHCGRSKTYGHGSYPRAIHFARFSESLRPHRRHCQDCGRTFGLLPEGVAPYQRTAVEVQDEVVRKLASGKGYEAVADATPSWRGPLSILTLRRWYARAAEQIPSLLTRLTALVLTEQPSSPIPVIPLTVRNTTLCLYYVVGEQWLRACCSGVSATWNTLRLAVCLFAPSVSVIRVSYGLSRTSPP